MRSDPVGPQPLTEVAVTMAHMSAPDRPSLYLTIAEAALELRCSAPTIRRRIASGELPAVKLGSAANAGIRIPRAALDRWLSKLNTAQPSGVSPDDREAA
jgi:excisionase family DNA binding protein